jgi:hypothetical protein
VLDHLLVNQTTNMTVAFPREVFHDLGERLDETLDTTKDWNFLLRAAPSSGSRPRTSPPLSFAGGSTAARAARTNDNAVGDLAQRRLDERGLLLPHGGSVQRLQELVELPQITLGEVAADRDRLATQIKRLDARFATVPPRLRKQRKKERLLRAPRSGASNHRRRAASGASSAADQAGL